MNSKIVILLAFVAVASAGIIENPTFCPMVGTIPKVRFTGCTIQPCPVEDFSTFTYNFDLISTQDHEGYRIEVSNMNTKTMTLNQIYRHMFPYNLVAGSRFTFNLDLSYQRVSEPIVLQIQVIGSNGAVEACSMLGMGTMNQILS